jgi:myo-inositol 2-dehydrogenase / D-chiro-inositol 1-dehydrogenase
MKKMGAKIKTGIIGCGHRAKGIINCLLNNQDYRITAVADINENASEEIKQSILPDVSTYTDYRQLLKKDEVEVVFIATPQFAHRQIAIEAFNAGKHVYCEKPMALTTEECDDMIKSSKKAKKILMIGQQMRYHAHLNKMKAVIDSGEIGKPVMMWLKEFRNPFPETMKWAFDKKMSGGLLLEKNCHHFDLFNWFMAAEPVKVYTSGNQDVIHRPFGIKSTILDNAWVTVDYANGGRAMLGICMFAGLAHAREGGVGTHIRDIGLIGEKGMMRTEGTDLGRNFEVRYPDNRNRVFYEIKTDGNIPDPYNGNGNRGILIKFAQCIRENTAPEVSGQIGKMAVAVSLAAEKSAEEKRIVKISEIMGNK